MNEYIICRGFFSLKPPKVKMEWGVREGKAERKGLGKAERKGVGREEGCGGEGEAERKGLGEGPGISATCS